MHVFNTARNLPEAEVPEALTNLTPQLINKLSTPAGGVRPDVAAAEESLQLAESASNLAKDKYKMSLDVFASLGINGHDVKASDAFSEGFTGTNPYRVIGLKINLPLGRSAVDDAREGYGKDVVVAELNASRKKFEADREWSELNRKFKEVKERLKLVEKLEEVQKRKLETERKKQQLGRSVVFQVVQYESDLVNAQLNVVRTKGELLSLVARMKIFGESK
jgi:outer membrane protein TolC